MTRTQTPAVALAERLCRPQRLGVFGHRGVGKTTLLTMLYREAVGGRLPGLRLAAADARTADYLADKVLQLEAGQPLPATLGETELRFHLYHQGSRLDLVVMDYQGEHVALGRDEPIRDFLRACDAVWLCLDAPAADTPASRLGAEQEVEQLVEDYLAAEDPQVPHRPMALVLTKADLLGEPDTHITPQPDPHAVQKLADERFGMTRHALRCHCPWHGVFAVSSLGRPMGETAFEPRPTGLDGPLAWLAQAMREQDEARLNRLWELAPHDIRLLARCTAAFARRYPEAPATVAFRRRLHQARLARLRRRVTAGLIAAATLVLGMITYDAWGRSQAERFAHAHADDPRAVRQHWRSFGRWHPTRNLLRPSAARAEEERLADLDREVRERERTERLADLRHRAEDPDADPEAVWEQFQRFRADFPEQNVDSEWQQFRAGIKARSDAQRRRRDEAARADRDRKAALALRELERAEEHASLAGLVEQADRFLREHAGSAAEPEVRRRRSAYLKRIDEHAIESARDYSTRHPLNFYTRRQRYQKYLDRHPKGAFVKEAHAALRRIVADWDRYDFRAIRDHYEKRPSDIDELKVRCRAYLAAHPDGRFRAAARELLRWTERVTTTGEYRVVLKSGSFGKKAAHMISRGPSLSVLIEVNGVRYGPSTIVARSYNPEWDYEFPRKVRWKLGQPVRIVVTDNYYWKRRIAEYNSEDDDKLAMRMLGGEIGSGEYRLTFESDFAMPKMPKIE
jgi:hypothetical protein